MYGAAAFGLQSMNQLLFIRRIRRHIQRHNGYSFNVLVGRVGNLHGTRMLSGRRGVNYKFGGRRGALALFAGFDRKRPIPENTIHAILVTPHLNDTIAITCAYDVRNDVRDVMKRVSEGKIGKKVLLRVEDVHA